MSPGDVIKGMTGLMSDDGGANYAALLEGMGIAGDVLSWVLGMLVVFILLMFPIVVALEVMFMNMPIFQSSAYKLMENNKLANKILGVCLRDAKRALILANTSQTGKSANKIYLGIKIKVIFITFFVIGIVLGPGVVILNSLIEVVQGFLDVLF